jgi:hypothetical protein
MKSRAIEAVFIAAIAIALSAVLYLSTALYMQRAKAAWAEKKAAEKISAEHSANPCPCPK